MPPRPRTKRPCSAPIAATRHDTSALAIHGVLEETVHDCLLDTLECAIAKGNWAFLTVAQGLGGWPQSGSLASPVVVT